jgi:DNA polymerase-3 subunit delta
MGHALSSAVAAHLVDMVGHDLGPVAEALERLGLYVGPSRPITEEAVSRMIAPIRAGTVWALTDALCDRNLKKSLLALGEMPLPRGSELMLLGAVTGSIRKLAKLEAALLGGEPLEAAGQRAGIPPFRITQTRDALRRLPPGTLERWLLLVAKAELDLKGGAKRPGRAIVESLVLALCA